MQLTAYILTFRVPVGFIPIYEGVLNNIFRIDWMHFRWRSVSMATYWVYRLKDYCKQH